MADPVNDPVPVIVQDVETGPRPDARVRATTRRSGGRARPARRGSGAARAASSGTRARPRGTRWRSRRSRTTATATRSSTACGRTAPRATPAPSRASRRGSGGSSPSARRRDPRARTSRACSRRPACGRRAKVGEEGVEAALAGVAESDERLVEELADLWFHSYVLLAARGLQPSGGRGRATPPARERRLAGAEDDPRHRREPRDRPCRRSGRGAVVGRRGVPGRPLGGGRGGRRDRGGPGWPSPSGATSPWKRTCSALFDATEEALGPLDGAVVNAGIAGRRAARRDGHRRLGDPST